MYKVLIIEDETDIREIIKDNFKAKGFEVIEAEDGMKGLEKYEFNPNIDLIILDVMMPNMDGWSVCRRIRKKSTIPIILLTARCDEDDELLGFELKADDYIKKPFSPNILVARGMSLIEKSLNSSSSDIVKLIQGEIELNSNTRTVLVSGTHIDLTVKEFDILSYMMKNPCIVLSRDTILNAIWGASYFGDDRVVDNHIKKIRKALGDKAYYIKTIFGVGYKFEAKS